MLDAATLQIALGVCLATLLGFGGRLWWALDLLAHFRVQYLLLSTAILVVLLLLGRRRAAVVLAACAGVNAAVLMPYLVPHTSEPLPVVATAASINVLTTNGDHAAVRRFVREARPDVLLLIEVDARWMEAMADLRREYPHGVAEPRSDNFGIALLSRHPCVRCRVVRWGEAGVPSVVGEFVFPSDTSASRVTFVGTHPLPPAGAEGARLQADQLRVVADSVAAIRGPKILMGDLNLTPWSAGWGPLLRRAGLRDSGAGLGVGRTWPVDAPFLGIAIDHFLSSPDVVAVNRMRGPDVGSDHFPLLVRFAIVRSVR